MHSPVRRCALTGELTARARDNRRHPAEDTGYEPSRCPPGNSRCDRAGSVHRIGRSADGGPRRDVAPAGSVIGTPPRRSGLSSGLGGRRWWLDTGLRLRGRLSAAISRCHGSNRSSCRSTSALCCSARRAAGGHALSRVFKLARQLRQGGAVEYHPAAGATPSACWGVVAQRRCTTAAGRVMGATCRRRIAGGHAPQQAQHHGGAPSHQQGVSLFRRRAQAYNAAGHGGAGYAGSARKRSTITAPSSGSTTPAGCAGTSFGSPSRCACR